MNKLLHILLEKGLNRGFSAIEAFGESVEKHEYECYLEEPPTLHTQETQRVIVRSFWETGNPVGFSLSKPNLNSIKIAYSNIYTSQLPDEKKNYRHLLPKNVKKIRVNIFDENYYTVDIGFFNELIDRINEIMISPTFQGLKIRKIFLSKRLKKKYIANTNNLNGKYRKSNFNLVLSFVYNNNYMDISENRILSNQFEPYKIISRGYNLLRSLTDNKFSGGKHLSLILSPEVSAFILREFANYFKKNAFAKINPDMMTFHYPSILNIVDNPYSDGLVGSVPFDDEGVQWGEKYLIQKGVFSTQISDINTAFLNNGQSTGNGFRSERFTFPSVGFSNLYIKPTVLPLKNLMVDAGEGILVSLLKIKFLENGDYFFSAYGYRFTGNDLLEPVHFYFKTSFRSFFLKILKVSKEIKFFNSSANIGSPYILLGARKRKAEDYFEI